MAERTVELDSAGVYEGMSLEAFGVRVSGRGVESVSRDQLRESIQHLQEEISSGNPLSSEDRAQLERVLGEVSGILESGEDDTSASAEAKSFDDLPGLVERFESTHPQLAVVLGRIADSLSQLGI